MVAEVKPGRINQLIPVPRLMQTCTWGGGAGVPRRTCTGHWHTNTKTRLSGGTAHGGAGADRAYT